LQRDGDDRKFVVQRPGINFTLRPTICAADDGIVVSRRQRPDYWQSQAASQQVKFHKMRGAQQNLLTLLLIS
jgi:hypothetical protein